MVVEGNPFTPSFGTLPSVLVGRDDVLAGIVPLFATFSKNDMHWATHLRGHRGVGKTVLLDQIQDAATDAGWWVIQEDAGDGPPLTSRIIDRALTRLDEHKPARRHRRVSSVTALGVGLEATAPRPASVTSVRSVLEAALSVESNGVLITIDEVHQAPDKALNEIGNAAQHLHRNGLPLVLVLAGLPQPERTKQPTFLGRAWQPALGRLSDQDVERCLVDTAETAGGAFEPLALRRALEVAAGEPFLMQLVGYHAWDLARQLPITAADVDAAAAPARTTYNRSVTAQMIASVSPDQRAFLASMVRHGTPARVSDIRADHDWSPSQAGVYRQRLLDAGLIVPAAWGAVDFAIPGVEDVLHDEV